MKIELAGEEFILFDENEIPTYATIFIDGIPVWKEIKEDNNGMYVEHNEWKEYVFVTSFYF